MTTSTERFGGLAYATGDKAFKNMTDQDFDLVTLVHLKGAYSCTRAAWPIFRKQQVGLPFPLPRSPHGIARLEQN